jgi:hypothetical protein
MIGPAVALALAGAFTPITAHQLADVHRGDTRWQVEHRIFDYATGVMVARWHRHTARDYLMRSGNFAEITYRHTEGQWRVTTIERFTP